MHTYCKVKLQILQKRWDFAKDAGFHEADESNVGKAFAHEHQAQLTWMTTAQREDCWSRKRPQHTLLRPKDVRESWEREIALKYFCKSSCRNLGCPGEGAS